MIKIASYLGIAKVVLVHSYIVNNDCHYDSRVLHTFITNENLWSINRYLTKKV